MIEQPLAIQLALISVTEKTGLDKLVEALLKNKTQIVATSGTYVYLNKIFPNQIASAEDFFDMPMLLEGRVKTLHPNIFAGLLFNPENPQHRADQQAFGFKKIDLLVCNFYDFSAKLKKVNSFVDALEAIDIGGVSLVRAAAKNFSAVQVLTGPSEYDKIVSELDRLGFISYNTRYKSMQKAWEVVFRTEQAIYEACQGVKLHYGENPQQSAAFIPKKRLPIGQETYSRLSYNNLLDGGVGLELLQELHETFPGESICVVIKHNIPCGVAVHKDLHQAFTLALASDPVSAYGCVLFFNQPLDLTMLDHLKNHFFDLVFSPSATPEAKIRIEQSWKKRLWVPFAWEDRQSTTLSQQRLENSLGTYVQAPNMDIFEDYSSPTVQKFPKDWLDLARFGILVVKYTKSNAVAFVRKIEKVYQLVGLGSGQPNRLDAITKLALPKMQTNFPDLLPKSTLLVSDGFLPFADNVEALKGCNIGGIVQPGGSMRDSEVIQACNDQHLPMLMTGKRYFKH